MVSLSTVSLVVASITTQIAIIFGQPDCVDKTLCFEKYDGYPEWEIDSFLTKHNPLPYKSDYDNEDLEKLNHEVDDEMNCSTKVEMLKPFSIKGRDRVYPVIQSKYFTQRIRHVSCVDHGQECLTGVGIDTYKYKTTCETKQSEIQLYVFDKEENEVKLMTAPFDCCCKCVIKDLTKDL